MEKQTWVATKFPGIRARLHPTRKHNRKPDEYYVLRFTRDGKQVTEPVGWASEGWTPQSAADVLAEIKRNIVLGEGARSLAEKRQLAEEKSREEARQKAQERAANLTFAEFFETAYMPEQKAHGKSPRSIRREEELGRLWILPAIGKRPLRKIVKMDLQRIKAVMTQAGRAPRSIEYCLAVVRQVFNTAKDHGVYHGDTPRLNKNTKQDKYDNKRIRFLSHDEAERLLAALAERSADVHDIALTSLRAGLRAGEVFSLTWQDVDLANGLLTLKDTKSGRTRHVPLTADLKAMFEERRPGPPVPGPPVPGPLVFPGRGGERITSISASFDRTVAALGFNDGIDDRRNRVCFHTLRHTYASHLVALGTSLYEVQELLGHSSLSMTQRYSHLAPEGLKLAVGRLDKVIKDRQQSSTSSTPLKLQTK